MKSITLFLSLMLAGCTIHHPIIERPFGFNWSANLEPKDEYTITYEVKFAEGFDFLKAANCRDYVEDKAKRESDLLVIIK